MTSVQQFEFLAPGAAVPFEGVAPALRSPIEWQHREAGAELAELDGWRVVASYGAPEQEAATCRRAVGVADLSSLGKFELQGDAATVAAIVSDLAGGAEAELGHAVEHEGVWWCPLTPERMLAVTPADATEVLRDALGIAAASGAGFASVNELTSALGSNAVVGPLARETFARTTALDLRPDHFPEAGFAPVSVARTAGMVLRERDDRFLHLFGAGYASYVWTVFVDAAEHLGGGAVGVEALGIEVPTHA